MHQALQMFVDRLEARSTLSADERAAVLALPTQLVTFPRGRDIVREAEVLPYSSLIVSGLVGRFGQTRSGARQFTALHIPGDMIDLHSVVRPVGIGGLNALGEATILRVPHDALRAIAARYPGLAEAFWRDCMLDAAILSQWVVNIGRRDARTRLAHLFCEMSIRMGRDRTVLLKYELPITQEQMGDATALTSVHVNRMLRGMRNLVTHRSGCIEIHDWEALARQGEFEDTYLTADVAGHPERLIAHAAQSERLA